MSRPGSPPAISPALPPIHASTAAWPPLYPSPLLASWPRATAPAALPHRRRRLSCRRRKTPRQALSPPLPSALRHQ
jgi:hypothetical protein